MSFQLTANLDTSSFDVAASISGLPRITVTDAASLMSALDGVPAGSVIELAGGNYGSVRLAPNSQFNFDGDVTIIAADLTDPPVFSKLDLFGVSNVTLSGLSINLTATSTSRKIDEAMRITNSDNIVLDKMNMQSESAINGVPQNATSLDATGNVIGLPFGRAIMNLNSSNITIQESSISQFFDGIRAGNVDGLRILNNDIGDLRTTPMGGSNVDNVVISGNYAHSSHPWSLGGSGDHGDYIHFWTDVRYQTDANSNMLITDNFFSQGDGEAILGIYLQNKGPGLGYDNVLIQNNVIWNGDSQGIRVEQLNNSSILNNTLLDSDGSPGKSPGIVILDSTTSTVVDKNIVNAIHVYNDSVSGVNIGDNLLVQRDFPGQQNYYSDLFANALSDKADLYDLLALPGSPVDIGDYGADITRSGTMPDVTTGFIQSVAGDGFNLSSCVFDASLIFDTNGSIDTNGASVVWDFGDGNTGTGLQSFNNFQQPGAYEVTATITLADGRTVTAIKTITVESSVGLLCDFDGAANDLSGNAHSMFTSSGTTFHGSGTDKMLALNGGHVKVNKNSNFVDNKAYTVLIDFEKGAPSEAGYLTYFSGSFTIRLGTDSISVSVTTNGQTNWLNANNIGIDDTNPHQLALTFSGQSGEAVLYLDGQKISGVQGLQGHVQHGNLHKDIYIGSPFSSSFNGMVDNFAFLRGEMSAADVSDYNAGIIQVWDLVGTVPSSVPLVPNVAPDANDDTTSLEAGQTISIDVLKNDTDPDGDALTISGASAQHGTVTLMTNGTLSYVADSGFVGIDTITYSVADGHGGTDTASVAVDVTAIPNVAPDANDDTTSLEAGQTISIDVLKNDTDPDGDALTISGASAQHGTVTLMTNGTLSYVADSGFVGIDTITYSVADGHGGTDTASVAVDVTAIPNVAPDANDDTTSLEAGQTISIDVLKNDTDPDGDALTISGASAQHGTVTLMTNGTLSYVADSGFVGIDTITYSVADGHGGTDTASVAVDVTAIPNVAPDANDDTMSLEAGQTISIDVLKNDTDPDGDALTISGASAQHGTVTLMTNGTLSYVADSGFVGIDTITYSVADGHGGTDTASVAVDVTAIPNVAPDANDDTTSLEAGQTISIDVLKNDTDPDGDALTISGASAQHGTVTLMTNGTLSYVADSGFVGIDTITYSVADGHGGTDTASVAVDVTAIPNVAPDANDDTTSLEAGQTISIDVLKNDTDPDGDALTISGASAQHGMVTLMTNGTLSYVADSGFVGIDTITYSVADGHGGTDTASVAVDVTAIPNGAPDANDDFVSVDAGKSVRIDVLANDTDPDDDQLTILVANANNGKVIVETNGELTYTPNNSFWGTDLINYSISDGQGGVDRASTYVTINPQTRPNPGEISETILTAASDFMKFNSMNDRVFGREGNDLIKGGGGDDDLYGEEGSDVLRGGAGDDHLRGGEGVDYLFGGEGNDFLYGGAGKDILQGDKDVSGSDTFVFEAHYSGEIDVIKDFSVEDGDQIDLSTLFLGQDIDALNIDEYVQLTIRNSQKLLLKVDTDGGGDNFEPLVFLDGVASQQEVSAIMETLLMY